MKKIKKPSEQPSRERIQDRKGYAGDSLPKPLTERFKRTGVAPVQPINRDETKPKK